MNDQIREIRACDMREKIHAWLCPPDPSTNYNKALRQRHPGSGQWFIRSSVYSAWKSQQRSSIWLHGIPGCGKTILSSTIIEDLERGDTSRKPLYFYFDFSDSEKQTFDTMAQSLIFQISEYDTAVEKMLQNLYEQHRDGKRQPSIEVLDEALKKILWTRSTTIILDALDECTARKPLLKWVRDTGCHVLLTSRKLEDISDALEACLDKGFIVDAQRAEVDEDIAAYVRYQLRNPENALAKTWAERPSILDKIEEVIVGGAGGM